MFKVSAFYKFTRIAPERLDMLQKDVIDFCTSHEIRGLFLLSEEGCNATMAGSSDAIDAFLTFLRSQPELENLPSKESECERQPFARLKLDRRPEIVTLNRPDIFPVEEKNNHLSPEEWHRILTSDEDYVLIDTRNTYEVEIGKFRGAVDPNIVHFSQFPHYVESTGIPRDKKILMYCTGGIRCEKALLYMKQEGYEDVYQLDGGILNYLKVYPEGEYEGECFVFDRRVAVDNHLQPSTQYRQCPHCGNPAKEPIICADCGRAATICWRCNELPHNRACSKDCAYRVEKRLIKQVAES